MLKVQQIQLMLEIIVSLHLDEWTWIFVSHFKHKCYDANGKLERGLGENNNNL